MYSFEAPTKTKVGLESGEEMLNNVIHNTGTGDHNKTGIRNWLSEGYWPQKYSMGLIAIMSQ